MPNFGTSLSDITGANKRFTLLQTGDTGHGKTHRTLTATRFGPLFIFDFDGKAAGFQQNPNFTAEQKKLIQIENFREKSYDEALKRLKELVEAFKPASSNELPKTPPFATVAIDTYSFLSEKMYLKAMGPKLEKLQKAEFGEWGMIESMHINFMNLFTALPCNLIINAHVRQDESEAGKSRLGPAGKGASGRDSLPKLMQESHYLYLDLGKNFVRARKSDTVPANTSLPETLLDTKGNLSILDLSVFDAVAYKVPA